MSNKKTAVYLRVSTEGIKNGREQSTGSQRLEIENYLKSKNIINFQVYEDVGISGTKKDRPQLKKMMKDCREGKIERIVIFKLDRLFRSLADLMQTIKEFQELKIEFVALKDGIDLSTAVGVLMMQIIGAFAEFEAAVIKERITSGLANAKSKGVKLGRPFKKGHAVVAKLKVDGMTVSEIVEHTGLSRAAVYKTLKQGETNEQ